MSPPPLRLRGVRLFRHYSDDSKGQQGTELFDGLIENDGPEGTPGGDRTARDEVAAPPRDRATEATAKDENANATHPKPPIGEQFKRRTVRQYERQGQGY